MKQEKHSIYFKRDKLYEQEIIRLKNTRISSKNKEMITEFCNYLFSTGSGNLRVAKLSSQIRRICLLMENELNLEKSLDEVKKNDILRVISYYNQQKTLSDATKSDYRRAIKQFFRWFREEDKRFYSKNEEELMEVKKLYTYLEKEVSTTYKLRQADPLTIITDEDIKLVVENGCRTPKEKAFNVSLHESGCRASEFLNWKIGDIEIKEGYAVVSVPDGKTGRRTIFLTKSVPYLIRYLDVHPFKKNRNSLIWISDNPRNKHEPLMHKGGQKLIDRCFERAKVDKKHNFHWYRHSRASILAPKMSEAMLCKYMGWRLGSHQVRTYCHLCVKQLEDVFLSIHGIRKEESDKDKPVECICGYLNTPNVRYCERCYKPLSVDVVIQDKELVNSEMNKTVKLLMEISQNPELMKKFQDFKDKFNEKGNSNAE